MGGKHILIFEPSKPGGGDEPPPATKIIPVPKPATGESPGAEALLDAAINEIKFVPMTLEEIAALTAERRGEPR